jgi:hypothetical protein
MVVVVLCALMWGLAGVGAVAQAAQTATPDAQAPEQTTPASPNAPEPPKGKVLFSRDTDAPAGETAPAEVVATNAATVAREDSDGVTDAERDALTFTAYDLDVHLTPASEGIAVRAGLTVRNDGAVALKRLALDISSSLRWDAISSVGAGASGVVALKFAVHTLDTDADHTGQMNEAVVTLAQPLAPGALVTLTALYSGAIPQSAQRLVRIGAPADKALAEDWDVVAASKPDAPGEGTALRGFGNVMWYPVAASPMFLGDGAKLFHAVGRAKLRESAATVRLRLAVEYAGEPPDAAFFCGRREQMIAISDNADVPVAEGRGIATAVFEERPLGFRTLSLFVTGHAASEAGTAADPGMIEAVTGNDEALAGYSAAAQMVAPMLAEWFGARPLGSLTILDHAGQPFEDDALLVRPMEKADAGTLAPSLAHSLTHAWIRSSRPWIDEGLAEFAGLLWTERTQGRAAALAEMQEADRALALAEPEVPFSAAADSASLGGGGASATGRVDLRGASSSLSDRATSASSSSVSGSDAGTAQGTVSEAGESLAAATGEVFYRTKAAAVWWMLRGLVGDGALQQALQAYRLDGKLDRDPEGFEGELEKVAHKDLRWFFDDWVYRDRALPDLSIVSVTPSQLTSRGGLPAGWLVAVEVHNGGYAEAEVPVTVRSATAKETERLRIPARSSASTRIVFAGTPEEVEINDGGVPETEASVHTLRLALPGR